ncbi:MAG: porin [Pseudomonadota bacterium]
MRNGLPALVVTVFATAAMSVSADAQTIVPATEGGGFSAQSSTVLPRERDPSWRSRGISMFVPDTGEETSVSVGDITGFTPRHGDLRVGITITDTATPFAPGSETLDIGVSYGRAFDDVELTMQSTMGLATRESAPLRLGETAPSSQNTLGFGASVAIGRFTLGGFLDSDLSLAEDTSSVADATAWDVGVGYQDGPWGLSLSYSRNQLNARDAIAPDLTTEFGAERRDQVTLGFNYKLADGVDVGAFGSYVADDNRTDLDSLTADRDVQGFVIGSGVEIDF